uniref:BOP1NT domain-containing protein n=1 Tax=Macrostomum lignano TaxID=282301 RepID=A0A1I8HS84_9PLAT
MSEIKKQPIESPLTAPDEYDYDSSDDEDIRNTVGNVPMHWYTKYPHIGYDTEGKKLMKPDTGDQLDDFMAKMDDPEYWRTVIDPKTGQRIVLCDEDVQLVKNIVRGRVPDPNVDPYEDHRCQDLHLAARVVRHRVSMDPEDLLPKLPAPRDLRPFPHLRVLQYLAWPEEAQDSQQPLPITACSVDPSGQWFAASGAGGRLAVFELTTGYRAWSAQLESASEGGLVSAAWNPCADRPCIAAGGAGSGRVYLVATDRFDSHLQVLQLLDAQLHSVYDLAKLTKLKTLKPNARALSCLSVHPTGCHLLAGSLDSRLAWFDLDLACTPYKQLRIHTDGVRQCVVHPSLPLSASVSDDGSCLVLHSRVYADLLENPLLVPVKRLRGHQVGSVGGSGIVRVTACDFHPRLPW